MSKRKAQQYDWFYRKPAWQKARQMALDRDNGLCTRCLKQKRIVKADVVHHKVYLTDDFSKALDLDNLECLCHSCHNKEHDEKAKFDRKSRDGFFSGSTRKEMKFDEYGNLVMR